MYIRDRLLKTTFKFTEASKTDIISMYAPDTNKTEEETDFFYGKLKK